MGLLNQFQVFLNFHFKPIFGNPYQYS